MVSILVCFSLYVGFPTHAFVSSNLALLAADCLICLLAICQSLFIKMGEPVIVCGKTEQIGQVIIAGLKPEYDGPWNPFSIRTCFIPLFFR